MTGSSADVDNYVTCLQDKRLSTYFIYVATTLYFYDFCLTFGAELCHVWQRRKPSLRNVLYLTARYCGFASAIAGTLPWTTLTLGNAITSLRLITIVASETILVHRTWVLWQHNKFVKRLLVATCIGSLAPCIFVVYEDIISEGVETSRPTPEINADDICSFLVSNATSLWIIPYIMSIFLELVTFLLASFAALLWRERIPSSVRSSLVGILWKDGAMYFGFMAGFSIFNILLVMSVSVPPPAPQRRIAHHLLQGSASSGIRPRQLWASVPIYPTHQAPIRFKPSTYRGGFKRLFIQSLFWQPERIADKGFD
ncbi:hypothetical protein PLEOSDRAFT_1107313 [Pleurotus ostreatus PC15]|uniref:DUF6533 domain-containing protein n=1 Tax=Pleurotus ostreatus (strain PC15) TaxID=1137138 RepID=A0A067NLB6_PLEO1|nr:hypothetical protein PLEOSDRAFT_1107313 [Pleurotus ostreatus PC15]